MLNGNNNKKPWDAYDYSNRLSATYFPLMVMVPVTTPYDAFPARAFISVVFPAPAAQQHNE
jgi:hypothetical protein